MIYRINFSDNSFLVVDENYTMCLFKGPNTKPKRLSITDFLKPVNKKRYSKYYFVEAPIDEYSEPTLLTFEVVEYDLDYQLPINNRYKMSQDIRVGDVVVGDNGEPDRVTSLHSGEEDMYQIMVDGEVLTVNGGHILHLKDREHGDEIDMPVNIFLHMGAEFQSKYVMIKE